MVNLALFSPWPSLPLYHSSIRAINDLKLILLIVQFPNILPILFLGISDYTLAIGRHPKSGEQNWVLKKSWFEMPISREVHNIDHFWWQILNARAKISLSSKKGAHPPNLKGSYLENRWEMSAKIWDLFIILVKVFLVIFSAKSESVHMGIFRICVNWHGMTLMSILFCGF